MANPWILSMVNTPQNDSGPHSVLNTCVPILETLRPSMVSDRRVSDSPPHPPHDSSFLRSLTTTQMELRTMLPCQLIACRLASPFCHPQSVPSSTTNHAVYVCLTHPHRLTTRPPTTQGPLTSGCLMEITSLCPNIASKVMSCL